MRAGLASAVVALFVASLCLRGAAPSDLWDQSQPRTIAYTVDMLVHGGEAWLLPRDGEGLEATKPPLYNWMAAPFVALLGRDSELGHRLPSVLSAIALSLFVVLAGSELGDGSTGRGAAARRGRRSIVTVPGLLAAAMLIASPAIFKIDYLARPDMLLVLWLFLAWWAATTLVALPATPAPPMATRWRIVFWGSVAAAGLTKGPPAALPLLHALILARIAGGELGTWRGLGRRLGMRWAIPALLVAVAWPIAVYLLDPDHALNRLWQQELVGRITGFGPEGGQRGPRAILLGLPKMPWYFIGRFAPWSGATIAAIVGLCLTSLAPRGAAGAVTSGGTTGDRRHDPGASTRAMLVSAAIWTGLVIVAFSLSSGKRADYLAPALPTAALLASWWLCDAVGARRVVRPVIGLAVLTIAASFLVHVLLPPLPHRTLRSIDELVARSRAALRAARAPSRPVASAHPSLESEMDEESEPDSIAGPRVVVARSLSDEARSQASASRRAATFRPPRSSCCGRPPSRSRSSPRPVDRAIRAWRTCSGCSSRTSPGRSSSPRSGSREPCAPGSRGSSAAARRSSCGASRCHGSPRIHRRTAPSWPCPSTPRAVTRAAAASAGRQPPKRRRPRAEQSTPAPSSTEPESRCREP
ncbi:MAG: hypothetical protein U0575_07335 [Phycisphaerales bacterium]